MNVTVIGAGNSGLAMAAHLSQEGHNVTLWNRSKRTISGLMKTRRIRCHGVIEGEFEVGLVTDDIRLALTDPDLILVTTPANSHKELAELVAKNSKIECPIVLNPGRTFGALEFLNVYQEHNKVFRPKIAETQTIIYTCRKTGEDSVQVISLKRDVLISTLEPHQNEHVLRLLPKCIQGHLVPAKSMIETSIGNVGMILHCAPLLLNAGWTENKNSTYKYYYDGITPSIGKLLEKIDCERVEVSKRLGVEVETTVEWLKRTYQVTGNTLFECIQANEAYKTIDAPSSLDHRYIFEDVPYGLVPLEAVGRELGLAMKYTTLIIDLANGLLEIDFRKNGRHLNALLPQGDIGDLISLIDGKVGR